MSYFAEGNVATDDSVPSSKEELHETAVLGADVRQRTPKELLKDQSSGNLDCGTFLILFQLFRGLCVSSILGHFSSFPTSLHWYGHSKTTVPPYDMQQCNV